MSNAANLPDQSITERANELIFKFEATLADDASCFHLNYENSVYREKDLAKLIWAAIPSFALTSEEYADYIKKQQHAELHRRGLERISKAKKNMKGDYGELLLYLVLELFYNSPKFVTKAKLRSTKQEQIKGFDCAHFTVSNDKTVTLWLGEAKFHKSLSSAVADAIESLKLHFNDNFIKDEIDLLYGNLERNSKLPAEHYQLLEPYLKGNKTLDDVKIRVPILMTYDSKAIKSGSDTRAEAFKTSLLEELNKNLKTYRQDKEWPSHRSIDIEFIFFPFNSVDTVKSTLEALENAHLR